MENTDKKNTLLLNVRVVDIFMGLLFEGDAYAVSSSNESGPFDILYGHENFITHIKNQITITDSNQSKREIKLGNGIIRCQKNKVIIFLGV